MAGCSATTECTRAPPSDQLAQGWSVPSKRALVGAESTTFDPSIVRSPNGVACESRPALSSIPGGLEAIVRSTVRG